MYDISIDESDSGKRNLVLQERTMGSITYGTLIRIFSRVIITVRGVRVEGP